MGSHVNVCRDYSWKYSSTVYRLLENDAIQSISSFLDSSIEIDKKKNTFTLRSLKVASVVAFFKCFAKENYKNPFCCVRKLMFLALSKAAHCNQFLLYDEWQSSNVSSGILKDFYVFENIKVHQLVSWNFPILTWSLHLKRQTMITTAGWNFFSSTLGISSVNKVRLFLSSSDVR